MKLQATKKEIKENSGTILSVGYCGIQSLFNNVNAFGYSCGVYGWSCDYYKQDNITISTGYSPIGKQTSYDINRKYEKLANTARNDYNISYKIKCNRLNKLRSKWLQEQLEYIKELK